MKPLLKFLPLQVCLYLTFSGFAASPETDISSPDGRLHFLISSAREQVTFTVILNGRTVAGPSPLLMFIDGTTITSGARQGRVRRFTAEETFPLAGNHSVAKDYHNGASIAFRHKKSGLKYQIEVKVFNDAAAFRLIVPGDPEVSRTPDEATVFKLPAGSTVWYHDLYMHYEGIHEKKLADTIPAGQWAAPPLTVRLPDNTGFLSITESSLLNYAGMALQSDGMNGFAVRLGHSHPPSYPYVLRYSEEDVKRLSVIASVKGTITTPWRVIIAGKDLNSLVNSDAVYSLCPAPDKSLFPSGTSSGWLKPGRAVWRYLDGGGDQSLKNMKEFSRLASELGFEYNILEGFWNKWPDDSVKALVDYSGKLGVGIIVWRHSNTLHDQKSRLDLFRRCSDLGIAGLKIDFFDHEAREVVDLYETILRETASLNLICIFHGANKPTGLWRTYPNAVIYEAVKGMEASKLLDRATHETTIPFTRMVAGPGDYSVCHFGARKQNTTWVHQTATAAIYSAPVITYAANPANILANPCAEMIKSIPPVWDETIVLPPSEIGEIAVFARRSGSTWFLSVINGTKTRTVSIPLTFLGTGAYDSYLLNDNPSRQDDAIVSRGKASRNDLIDLNLGTGGGFIGRFTLK